MSFFARLEAVCNDAVERAFAVAFPSALEPVQIARKLVAAYEAAVPTPRGSHRFVVTLSAADHARLAADLPYLEAQWRTMLARLAERSGRLRTSPEVRAEIGASVATGTVSIVAEPLEAPLRLVLRVRRGVPPNATALLGARLSIGRDPACDLVLVDPRVSRRHCTIEPVERGLAFRDLGSSNGITLNGVRRTTGALALGDVLGIGDCELVVEGAPSDGAR
ncbi:MAG: DUF3662 and FHA domain-containing protein [Vulcanimicrobiaceae bacterium]